MREFRSGGAIVVSGGRIGGGRNKPIGLLDVAVIQRDSTIRDWTRYF